MELLEGLAALSFGWVMGAAAPMAPPGREDSSKQPFRKEREWTNKTLPWIDWAMELMELMEWINQWRRVVFVNGAPRSLAPRQANNSTNLSFLHKRRKVVVLAEWNVFLFCLAKVLLKLVGGSSINQPQSISLNCLVDLIVWLWVCGPPATSAFNESIKIKESKEGMDCLPSSQS